MVGCIVYGMSETIVETAESVSFGQELGEAIRTVVSAEMSGADIIDSGPEKNNHFEFQFGEKREDEVYVYLERLHQGCGFEVLFWVDESYFYGVESQRPSLSDGGELLETFVYTVLEKIIEMLPEEASANPSHHMDAASNVVIADVFYLQQEENSDED